MAGASDRKRGGGGGSGGRNVKSRREGKGDELGGEKRQEEDAANPIESSSTTNSISLEREDTLVSGSGSDSVDSKKKNKTKAQKRKDAALKKQQQEQAAAAMKKKKDDEAAALKKQQEAEAAALKTKQEADAEAFKKQQEAAAAALKKKHEEEAEALKRKQQDEEAKALKRKQQEEAEKQSCAADPLSPVSVDSPSPVALKKKHEEEAEALKRKQHDEEAESLKRKQQEEAEKQSCAADPLSPVPVDSPSPVASPGLIPDTMVSDKGIGRLLVRKDGLDDFQYRTTPPSQKKSKWQQQESSKLQKQLEVEEEKKRQEEEQKKLLDQSLRRDGLSFADLARKAGIDQKERMEQQAAMARQKATAAQKQAAVEEELKKNATKKLKDDFVNFLNRFIREDTKGYFYKKMVGFMKDIREFNLKVDFEDILKSDPQLAVDIVNGDRCCLLPAVKEFLIKEGFGPSLTEEVKWKGKVTFLDIPKCITCLTEFLKNPDSLVEKFADIFGEGHQAYTLTELACCLLVGFLSYIFYVHSLGRTWNGDFTANDMYVPGNDQFGIAKKPAVLSGDPEQQFSERKKDIQRVLSNFLPYLDCRKPKEQQEPAKNEDLPLFVAELKDEIDGMKAEDLLKPWYIDFILNHPALKLPQARHDLVCDTHLALQNGDSANVEAFGALNVRLKVVDPSHGNDWRKPIKESEIALLHQIYIYNEGKEAEGGKTIPSKDEPFPPSGVSCLMTGMLSNMQQG